MLLVLAAIAMWAWLARERSGAVENGVANSVSTRAAMELRTSPSLRGSPARPPGLPAIPFAEATQRANAPSAECIAARARDARESEALVAMAPAQRDAHIEASARDAVEEEQSAMRAADACEGTAESDTLQCLLSAGFSRAADVLRLYRDHKAIEQAHLRHAERVAGRGDARSLLAAAHILPFAEAGAWSRDETLQRRPDAIAWIVRAQRIGADDAVVQWGVATFREYGGRTTEALERARSAAARRLLVLEPDNAAAHLLPSVTESRDPLPIEGFKRLAAMPRYRTSGPELATLLLDSFRDMPVEPAFRRAAILTPSEHLTATHCASDPEIMLASQLSVAHRVANAGSLELLTAVQGPCSEGAMTSKGFPRSECLTFAARLHGNSRTVLEHSTATAMLRRLATTGLERLQWQKAHRRHRWQLEEYATAALRMDPYARARIEAAAWRSGDEMSGIRAVLAEVGVPLEPPSDWRLPGEPSG